MVLILAASGCQLDPYSSHYARSKPDPSWLIGKWQATPETLKQLASPGSPTSNPVLKIRADGSIGMFDIPSPWLSDVGKGGGHAKRIDERWEPEHHQGRWWGLTLRDPFWDCSGCLMILGNDAPYRLVLRYGDPDKGLGYEFEKRE